MRRIIIVAVLLLSLTIVAPASALRSAVYFEGGAENFVFYPGSEWSDTDIFGSLKNAMPGDTITQQIKIRNTASEYDSVKIYIRAKAHGGDNPLSDEVAATETVASIQDFLAQLHMKVWNNDELIFDASPNELGGLSENVFLGTFLNGASTTLKIELAVPSSLGSEYMHRAGEVDWIFTAEGYKDEVAPDEPTPTPDNSRTLDNIIHYSFTFGLSAIGLIISVIIIRRLLKKEA